MSRFKSRSLARELIVQVLYAKPQCNISIDDLVTTILQECYTNQIVDIKYAKETAQLIYQNKDKIDNVIKPHISRSIETVTPVERAILHLGAFELTNKENVIDARIVINECINIAKQYGAQGSHKFINACLDKISKQESV